MKKVLFVCLMFAVASVVSSCKKDDDNPGGGSANKSNSEKLVGKNWKLTAFTVNPPIGSISDIYAEMDDCNKDDFFNFNTNGTYTGNDGSIKCDPTDPQTWSGTWSISSDQKMLTMDSDVSTIKNITETNMVLEFQEVDAGTTYTYTMTYTKQ